METMSHMFLVFFYCLSGAIIIIYLLIRWAINYRLNTVRSTIRSYARRAESMNTLNKGFAKLNDFLTEKEKLIVEASLQDVKTEFQKEKDDIVIGTEKVGHVVSELEYKSKMGSQTLWPSWAKRKLQKIVNEMQDLRVSAKQATQY